MCLTFQMMTLEKNVTKNFGPSKCGVSKNDHPSTAYDPTFLLQNPFPHKKCGCLQKTRAQSVKIWPRYRVWSEKVKVCNIGNIGDKEKLGKNVCRGTVVIIWKIGKLGNIWKYK